MTYIRNLLRLFLSIIVGILFIIAMPIYDEPFSGCTTSGFATLELDALCGLMYYSVLVLCSLLFALVQIVADHNFGGLLL